MPRCSHGAGGKMLILQLSRRARSRRTPGLAGSVGAGLVRPARASATLCVCTHGSARGCAHRARCSVALDLRWRLFGMWAAGGIRRGPDRFFRTAASSASTLPRVTGWMGADGLDRSACDYHRLMEGALAWVATRPSSDECRSFGCRRALRRVPTGRGNAGGHAARNSADLLSVSCARGSLLASGELP